MPITASYTALVDSIILRYRKSFIWGIGSKKITYYCAVNALVLGSTNREIPSERRHYGEPI